MVPGPWCGVTLRWEQRDPAPTPKHQAPSKHQARSTKHLCKTPIFDAAMQEPSVLWCLVLGAWWGIGSWSLVRRHAAWEQRDPEPTPKHQAPSKHQARSTKDLVPMSVELQSTRRHGPSLLTDSTMVADNRQCDCSIPRARAPRRPRAVPRDRAHRGAAGRQDDAGPMAAA